MTIRIIPYINDPVDVLLDDDIAAFKLEDLVQRDIEAAVQEILVQKQIELSSGKRQCRAMNYANNPALKTRCSAANKKGEHLCHFHFKRQTEGKTLVLADDQ
jgi:hypothetical protein